MHDVLPLEVIAVIAAGDEALDRGMRGASVELDLLRDAGALSAPLPANCGGQGWGTTPAGAERMRALLSALGAASLPIARLYEGHVNAIKLVSRYGDSSQQARVWKAVHDGGLLGVWGAERERPVTIEAGVLSGIKTFASGLGDVTLGIVTATTADGLRMVLIDTTDQARADFTAWDVDGMIGSRSGCFDCSGLFAGAAECIGPPDALFSEPDFHGGLWRLTACYAGAMERLAILTADQLERAGNRSTPLMAHRVGRMAVEATGAALWARSACFAVEENVVSPARAVAAALLAREAVEQSAVRLLALVERINGTAMHRRGSPIGRLSRDLRLYLRQADLDGKLGLAAEHWYVGGQ